MIVNRIKLEIAMANACLSTQQLQEKANIPRPTLNNAITGRSVRPATVGRIARALNVSVEDLIEL